jgi:two-component system cell cycle response regulator
MKTEPGVVLVVDDEDSNRRLLQTLLQKQGHTVCLAATGREALSRLEQDKPDVILMDVLMPEMDGYEACRRIKENPATAHLPVLVLTSLTDRAARIRSIAAGADDFLTRPLDQEEIQLRVRNAIASKRLFDEVQAGYRKLRQMEELRDSITRMIADDTRALEILLATVEQLKREASPKSDTSANG